MAFPRGLRVATISSVVEETAVAWGAWGSSPQSYPFIHTDNDFFVPLCPAAPPGASAHRRLGRPASARRCHTHTVRAVPKTFLRLTR